MLDLFWYWWYYLYMCTHQKILSLPYARYFFFLSAKQTFFWRRKSNISLKRIHKDFEWASSRPPHSPPYWAFTSTQLSKLGLPLPVSQSLRNKGGFVIAPSLPSLFQQLLLLLLQTLNELKTESDRTIWCTGSPNNPILDIHWVSIEQLWYRSTDNFFPPSWSSTALCPLHGP